MYYAGETVSVLVNVWDDGETPGVPRGFLAFAGDAVEVVSAVPDGPVKVRKNGVDFSVHVDALGRPD